MVRIIYNDTEVISVTDNDLNAGTTYTTARVIVCEKEEALDFFSDYPQESIDILNSYFNSGTITPSPFKKVEFAASLYYKADDEQSVKKAFEALMPQFGGNKGQVLTLLENNPIAMANADVWAFDQTKVVAIHPVWTPGIWVIRDNFVTHENIVYRVIQSHTPQLGQEPNVAFALFRAAPVIHPGEAYPRWKQPIDSEDSYPVDDRVTHNGVNYKSNINANVFEPPQQWTDLSSPPAGYPAWAPWPGSGPTYQVGDRVTHNGNNWESTAANNVWEPGVFGWVQI